jgi:uncharacterized damage-inducible protein DinB
MKKVELLVKEIRKELQLRLCDESLQRITKCVELLNYEEIWYVPSDQLNSIGNLILHLNGNIRQWLLDGLFGLSYTRIRDNEFSARKSHSKEQLLDITTSLITDIERVKYKINIDMLLGKKTIQSHFRVSGFSMISHVIEHASYHTGQIALLTKWIVDEQVGFYEDLDL